MAGSSTNRTPVRTESQMTPSSMTAAIPPSASSVVAALRDLGRSKAGTPLEIASMPVRAAQPEENARSTRNAPARPVSPAS